MLWKITLRKIMYSGGITVPTYIFQQKSTDYFLKNGKKKQHKIIIPFFIPL